MYHMTCTPGALLSSKLQMAVRIETLSFQTQLIRKEPAFAEWSYTEQ
jgi:hypothetical protein